MPISQAAVDAVLEHILHSVEDHRKLTLSEGKGKPFVIGLTGLQGSGKSTWASSLVTALKDSYELNAVTLSLDDLYHDHANLVRLREANPKNGLLRTRGHPGSHDEQLARRFFDSLHSGEGDIMIPSFDKSKFNGEGDRAAQHQWQKISRESQLDVLVFEGWCVGFQPLSVEELEQKWTAAKQAQVDDSQEEQNGFSTTTLAKHSLESLKVINDNLRHYCTSFMGPSNLNYLVHLDTDDLVNVYRWRMDQERVLRREKGFGMTDEAVVRFVQGYMPGYELYLDRLRRGSFVKNESNEQGKRTHLRVVLDKDRTVIRLEEL